MSSRDWAAWHRDYDRPDSHLAARLGFVQRRIRDWLEGARPGPLRALSLCGGEGRDLVGALAAHPRGVEVAARIVELEPRNVAAAKRAAADAGLPAVEVVEADASLTDACTGAVPADLLLACGIFGNVSGDDIRATIGALPSLCAAGATVIWTRHRLPPDRTPDVRRWFSESGFEEVGFDAPAGWLFSVGSHRLAAPPAPFVPGRRLFTFVGFDALLVPVLPDGR